MDQKKTVEETKLGSETLDEARARWHREYLESKQRADKINKKFHEAVEATQWKIRQQRQFFINVVQNVFGELEQRAPFTDEKDAWALMDAFVQKTKDVVCKRSCDGMWSCERCPIHKDFEKIQEGVKEDGQAKN